MGCAGSSVGNSVQQSLEADPQLEEAPPFESASQADTEEPEEKTAPGLDTPPSEAPSSGGNDPATSPPSGQDESPSSDASSAQSSTAPEPGEPDFIGPVWAATAATNAPSIASEQIANEAEFAGVAADLQTYIVDLQALGLLTVDPAPKATGAADAASDSATSLFAQPITRREYARWLFESYNTIYADEPGDRLRAGTSSDTPAFKDVAASDPDFAAIQGLAEAGIIPSAFSGSSTDVNFRPDAPLGRAALILWKVPLDVQSVLPTTTPEAVAEAWGFQDTATIDPLALRAIAADYQLGDFANFSRAFGYTTLFRPEKPVTRAEAAAVLWRFGTQTEGRTAPEAESQASSAAAGSNREQE